MLEGIRTHGLCDADHTDSITELLRHLGGEGAGTGNQLGSFYIPVGVWLDVIDLKWNIYENGKEKINE